MSAATTGPDVEQLDALLAQVEALQQQLNAVREELTESHRLTTLGTIAAIVAHEFNNILTPIISYAQMAQARPEDTPLQQKAIERALDGAQRAAKISSSMLGFASPGCPEEHPTSADLRTCIDDALACLAREPKRDGIALHVNVVDVEVAMPAVELMQVLVNLLLNARKAMGQQGGRLGITAARSTAQGRPAVEIAVSDTGPGIPAAVRERLFEPFVTHPSAPPGGTSRSHAPTDPQRKGTGLGLCICRQLVSKAGGKITFDTSPAGTTFTLILPVVS